MIKLKFEDDKYPQKLRNIVDPPKVLYCEGNINLLNDFSIAIIGCRKVSDYGRKIARIFSDKLSKSGVTIVSGLARGVDSIAHESSYENIGRTIAVLRKWPRYYLS